jgi:hypothetical protein
MFSDATRGLVLTPYSDSVKTERDTPPIVRTGGSLEQAETSAVAVVTSMAQPASRAFGPLFITQLNSIRYARSGRRPPLIKAAG